MFRSCPRGARVVVRRDSRNRRPVRDPGGWRRRCGKGCAAACGGRARPGCQLAAAGAQRGDGLDLAVGQHLGAHFIDAQLARHGLRRVAVVAGDHGGLQALRVQRRDRVHGRRLDRIGHRDHGGGPAVDGDVDRRLVHEYHGEKRGDLYFTKDMLLAVGDRYEAEIARRRAEDAPYR